MDEWLEFRLKSSACTLHSCSAVHVQGIQATAGGGALTEPRIGQVVGEGEVLGGTPAFKMLIQQTGWHALVIKKIQVAS